MAKVNGEKQFEALFSVVNELEQIRYQSFVPTKSLEHIRPGLTGISKSLEHHGHRSTSLAFTDNVRADYATGTACIPSLKSGVLPRTPSYTNLPEISLPNSSTTIHCQTFASVDEACNVLLTTAASREGGMVIGTRVHWNFILGTDGVTRARQVDLVILATAAEIYVLYVGRSCCCLPCLRI